MAQLATVADRAGTAAEPPLALAGIVKRWPGVPPVLEGVDLRLEAGRAAAIEGRNGAGKTTLLRIACGLILPDSGTVRLSGIDPELERTEFHRRVGFLSAGNSGLYARLRAEHHLEMWARLALLPRSERVEAVRRAVERFALEPLCGRRVDRLSMGQRQRLRLALAFLHEPEVVLLDEPGTSLDEDGLVLLGSALDALKERGGAALVCLPSGWDRLAAVDDVHALVDGRLERA
jgi:ABC-type multidrug transport system ATPase subunit